MSPEDDWQRWCVRFDESHNGILRLFHDRVIWRAIMAMLDANPDVTRGSHGEAWLGLCYTTTQLIAIRRETAGDHQSIGMRRSLNGLASNPRMATRAWYEEHIQQTRQMERSHEDFRELAGMFNRFAGPGDDFIDHARVRHDISALDAVITRVNEFTTKTLAHRDDVILPGKPPAQPITWQDLDDAIDAVGNIHRKYYSLRHPGESVGPLTPLKTGEWTLLFDTAWMQPGFAVPHEYELDPPA